MSMTSITSSNAPLRMDSKPLLTSILFLVRLASLTHLTTNTPTKKDWAGGTEIGSRIPSMQRSMDLYQATYYGAANLPTLEPFGM